MNEKIKEILIENGISPEFLNKVEAMNLRLKDSSLQGLSREEYQTYRDYCERLVDWSFKKG
jgi:hypothetical protein